MASIFRKKSGRRSSAGTEILNFHWPLLSELLTDFGLFYTKIKLKCEDLENIKADRVDTVVFNLHQTKRQALFGTPG